MFIYIYMRVCHFSCIKNTLEPPFSFSPWSNSRSDKDVGIVDKEHWVRSPGEWSTCAWFRWWHQPWLVEAFFWTNGSTKMDPLKSHVSFFNTLKSIFGWFPNLHKFTTYSHDLDYLPPIGSSWYCDPTDDLDGSTTRTIADHCRLTVVSVPGPGQKLTCQKPTELMIFGIGTLQ